MLHLIQLAVLHGFVQCFGSELLEGGDTDGCDRFRDVRTLWIERVVSMKRDGSCFIQHRGENGWSECALDDLMKHKIFW